MSGKTKIKAKTSKAKPVSKSEWIRTLMADGYDDDEIAQRLGVSKNLIHVVRHEDKKRAQKKLKKTSRLLKAAKQTKREIKKVITKTKFKPRIKSAMKSVETPVVSKAADAWRKKNAWFGVDEEKTAAALGMHEMLIKQGVKADSRKYWKYVNLWSKNYDEVKDSFDQTLAKLEDKQKTAKKIDASFDALEKDIAEYKSKWPEEFEEIENGQAKSDAVNHPPHYKAGGIETIDFIEAKDFNYRLGNVIKYVSRAGKKLDNDPVQDLEKAMWYLKREIDTRKNA